MKIKISFQKRYLTTQNTCPKCGSSNVEKSEFHPDRRCNNCNHTWLAY